MRSRKERSGGSGGRAARRIAGAMLGATVLLSAAMGCDREPAPDYGGDPEGRIVTAGATADELVTRGATARRIAKVELNAGLVERWFGAQERLEELASSDPDVRRLLDERDGGDGGESAITEAARHLERDSRVRGAIESAGLSTHEFVLTALALHQALLASSPGAPPELRSLAARNVRFVGRNAALLERLAAPRPPRVLAYGDTVSPYGSFVDTLTTYDEAPYDLSPYSAAAYGQPDSLGVIDSLLRVEPPAVDTTMPPVIAPPPLPLPVPVVVPPPPPARARSSDSVIPPRPRGDSAAARRDTSATQRPPTVPPPVPPVIPTSPPPR